MAKKRQRGIFERPKGSGLWWIDYRDASGRRRREKIGAHSAAVTAYRRRQRNQKGAKFVAPTEATFSAIARERMTARQPYLAASSVRTDEIRLRPIVQAFGKLPVGAVSPARIETFLAGIVSGGCSKATANRYRALLSSVFKLAVRNGRIRSNPCNEVQRFKESPGRVRFLSSSEEDLLRSEILQRYPDREPEFDLALNTGMRRGEQFGLRRSSVDLDRGLLTVSGKTGQRYITLNTRGIAAVRRLLDSEPGDYLCGAKREGQRDSRRWFERCVRAAGISSFRFHDLRHTFASRLVMAGVDLTTVKDLMGHKSFNMTLKYAHLSPDHRRASVEKIA